MSNQKKSNKKVAISQDQREKQELLEMKKLDTTPLKEEIYQLRQQLNYLISQKSTQQSQMVRANDKYMKDSFEVQKTIKIQEQELTDLQNNYKLLRYTFQDNRRKHKTQWQSQIDLFSKKKQQEKQNYNKNISQLQKKIEHLKQFKTRQIEYLATIAKLKEKQQNNLSQQSRDIQKIVNEHEGKRKEVRETVQKEIDNIKELEVNKLEQKMNRQQQIKRQNEIIMEQIALCESQKVILEQEYQQLMQGNDSNQNINSTSLLQGQANETYERSLRVIKLENKLTKLREYLQQETTRLDQETKSIEAEAEMNRREMEGRIGKAESWLKLKDKDLKKMKACSQMVLNQRSTLESYLLEVFHEHSELDYKDPANINQILRFLFIKINSKKPPLSYKDHLLSTEQSQVSKQSIS